ncbi:MAG TPA: hypothetical protein VEU33_36450 [Archangium sp.]|nr:hypothetical protein [Archangium sp.]
MNWTMTVPTFSQLKEWILSTPLMPATASSTGLMIWVSILDVHAADFARGAHHEDMITAGGRQRGGGHGLSNSVPWLPRMSTCTTSR